MAKVKYSKQECSYEHNVDTELFDDIPDKKWKCPHKCRKYDRFCPLHKKSANEQEVRKFVIDTCNNSKDNPKETQFFGSRCRKLNLGYAELGSSNNSSVTYPIDFRDSNFSTVNFKKSRIKRPVSLAGSTIEDQFDCKQAVFQQTININNTRIKGQANMNFASFDDWCDISNTEFNDEATFNGAIFSRGIIASQSEFSKRVDFVNTNFKEMANFRDVVFNGYVNFAGPEFFLDARFDTSEFKSPVFFENAKFHQVGVFRDSAFEKSVSFRNCLAKGRISFQNTIFNSSALFPGVNFNSVTTFNGAQFQQGVDLRKAFISELRFKPAVIESSTGVVEFTNSNIESGIVQLPEFGVSTVQLTGAKLGDIRLRSEQTDTTLDSFALDDVRYNGFHFDTLEDELRDKGACLEDVEVSTLSSTSMWKSLFAGGNKRSQPTNADNTNSLSYSELERTYRKAKNGADIVGEPKISSYFFRKEMIYRRKKHWDTVFAAEKSIVRRLTASFEWIANTVLYLTAGYGERPSWVVVTSISTIILFSIAYNSVGIYTGENNILTSLLFSAQSFVTFIVGGSPESTSLIVELLSVSEGFIGAFLVAVFVFTLTRTVYR